MGLFVFLGPYYSRSYEQACCGIERETGFIAVWKNGRWTGLRHDGGTMTDDAYLRVAYNDRLYGINGIMKMLKWRQMTISYNN
jgi:hypothetical protein